MLSPESGSRRLGVANILDGAWVGLWKRPLGFLGLGLVAGALQVFSPSWRPGEYDPAHALARMGLGLLYGLLGIIVNLAVIWLADRVAAGERPGPLRALAASLRAMPRYIATAVLMSLILLGLFLLLIVPGVIWAVYYTFTTQAVLLRGKNWKAALDHSKALVKGRWWRVFGISLLFGIPLFLTGMLTTMLPEVWPVRIGLGVLTAFFLPYYLVCLTLLFLRLDPSPARAEAAPAAGEAPRGPGSILVLGGGQQGRVIATDLATRLPGTRVTVADLRDPGLSSLANLAWQQADCSSAESLAHLMAAHDLVVGALPSRLGFGAMKAAIAARRNLVDVSFCAEDALALAPEARAAGVTIVPDAGLAPGLSNLLAGEAYARRGAPQELLIMVGGVAQDPAKPYGYCVTWSLDDLTEEYVRPARIVSGGQKVTVPVFSGMEEVEVEGVGRLVAFYSDGLRSLMDTLPGVSEMGEKTMRWPGHVEAVQPLLAEGRLAEELRARCTLDPPEDLVVMLVRTRWADGSEEVRLVDRYDPASGLTAMARTTAFTTAVTAHMLASGIVPPPGVQPLELVAAVPRACRFIAEGLAEHGVKLERRSF